MATKRKCPKCNYEGEDFVPGIVLDPFAGSCTTALVAYKLRRDYVMIELQPDYIKIANQRLTAAREQYSLLEIK